MSRRVAVALDIDGTLVGLAGAGARAMDRAFCAHLGLDRSPRRSSFAGRTDRSIALEVLEQHRRGGETDLEAELSGFFGVYLRLLPEEIDRTPYQATPGAMALLEELDRTPGVMLGLATGNLAEAARLKLRSAGLRERFDFGAFGHEVDRRDQLLTLAFERAWQRLPAGGPAISKVMIGDTPHDVEAARAVGAFAVAVAQGPFSSEQLGACGPDLLVDDLLEALRSRFWSDLS